MNILKPFFLGGVGGLVLTVILLIGLYASPLRETLYFRADPEISVLREELARHQEWMSATDLRIAGESPGKRPPDSLQTAQVRAWREYKQARNRLAELARAHADGRAAGFWDWAFSLRYWAAPGALGLALFPGLLFSGLILFGSRRKRRRPEKKVSPRSQALESFQAAVRKVAVISDVPVTSDVVASDKAGPTEAGLNPDAGRKTEFLPPGWAEAKTVPGVQGTEPGEEGDGRGTRYPESGPGWGDAPVNSGTDPNGAGTPELDMEDEDEAAPGSVLPPTTELERVERKKAEVLKLARKGVTSSEISRRLRISQDQVEIIIRLRRDRGA